MRKELIWKDFNIDDCLLISETVECNGLPIWRHIQYFTDTALSIRLMDLVNIPCIEHSIQILKFIGIWQRLPKSKNILASISYYRKYKIICMLNAKC